MRFFIIFSLCILLASCGMRSIPTAQNDVEAAWAQVENQYKRRADLIPNLVKTVKGYASHEKETLEAVVSARAKATSTTVNASDAKSLESFSKNQAGLSSALSRLMVVVEKYPNLKADQNFRDLQNQLEGTENRITIARKRYIESVNIFNKLVTVPPESWYNSIFLKLEKLPQFKVDNLNEIQDPPKVEF